MDNDSSQVQKIINSCLYATIATTDTAGAPWNSPVFVCNDDSFTFYWASAINAQHSRNIENNGHVFLVMFDSHAPWGEGKGVYTIARASIIDDEEEIDKVCKLRRARVSRATQTAKDFSGSSPRRIYKALPKEIWLNDVEIVDGKVVDVKTKIDLSKV